MTEESFADAPISITEARSDRTGKSETWTPRDCLISFLRQIDRGELKPEQVIIVWATDKNEECMSIHRSIAGPYTTLECLGMLTRVQHTMQVSP